MKPKKNKHERYLAPKFTQSIPADERERVRAMEGAGLIYAQWRKRLSSRRRTEAEVAAEFEHLRQLFIKSVKRQDVLDHMLEMVDYSLGRWKLALSADAADFGAALAALSGSTAALNSADPAGAATPALQPGRHRTRKPGGTGGAGQPGSPANN